MCVCVCVCVRAYVCVCVCMCVSIHVHVVQHVLFVDAVPQYVSWSVVCSDCMPPPTIGLLDNVEITADSHSYQQIDSVLVCV